MKTVSGALRKCLSHRTAVPLLAMAPPTYTVLPLLPQAAVLLAALLLALTANSSAGRVFDYKQPLQRTVGRVRRRPDGKLVSGAGTPQAGKDCQCAVCFVLATPVRLPPASSDDD